jgi:hypothetical protein
VTLSGSGDAKVDIAALEEGGKPLKGRKVLPLRGTRSFEHFWVKGL